MRSCYTVQRLTSGRTTRGGLMMMLRGTRVLLGFSFLLSVKGHGVGGSFEIDDSEYDIAFRLSSPDDFLKFSDPETVFMRTKEMERYYCFIEGKEKEIGEKMSKVGTEFASSDPIKILRGLSIPCYLKAESYWTYEFCHGKSLRQFHFPRFGEPADVQYTLGKITPQELEEEYESSEGRKPSIMRVNDVETPFLEITMGDGTLCDLNGKPRVSRIRYICASDISGFVSIRETSTCEYEVIFAYYDLCEHPDLNPKYKDSYGIRCSPVHPKKEAKPKALLADEENIRRYSGVYNSDSFVDVKEAEEIKIVIKTPTDTLEEYNIDSFIPSDQHKEDNWKPVIKEPPATVTDPHIIEQFLMGEYCLYGGAGWWKYEFCYGKSVIQYHEEKGIAKVEIVLGRFIKENHIEWIAENPGKKPKRVGRKFVSHFYSHGDFCDLSGVNRHVEVKLKCKKSNSPSAVTIYLLEPSTCQYVLGVESSLVCDILHLANEETGLIRDIKKTDFVESDGTLPRKDAESNLPFDPSLPFKEEFDNEKVLNIISNSKKREEELERANKMAYQKPNDDRRTNQDGEKRLNKENPEEKKSSKDEL